MASIRKRGKRWHVQVRRKGHPSLTRSFLLKSDAEAWGRQRELEADRLGLPTAHKRLRDMTVADVIVRYRDEIVPTKRAGDREAQMLNGLLRHPLAQARLSDVTTGEVSAYCAERLRRVKPSSLNRELDILRHAFNVAKRNWDIPLGTNVFAEVTRPKGSFARERRLKSEERDRLLAAARQCQNRYIPLVIELALETGMRRGELLRARWCDLSFERRTLHIPLTKNGRARIIPLSRCAIALLRGIRIAEAPNESILGLTANTVKMAWGRVVRRAGLQNLRFHDLRHEAISSFFEKGLSIPEVALISGHRDARMLFRYTHPRPEDVALKLL
jgi:integrase